MVPLPQRPYGGTGQQVSVLGLGGAFGGNPDFNQAVATVHRALELGITYFDSSPMYVGGLSQAIFGAALAGREEPYLIATKLGYFGKLDHFRSEDALEAQLHANLRLLRRDRVDTLQLHESDMWMWWRAGTDGPGRIHTDEPPAGMDQAPALRVLRRAKANGRCRFIGVTGNGAPEVGRVVREVDVDTVLTAFNYSLIGHSARELVIPQATRKGCAVMLGGVFQRLLRLPPDWRTHSPAWMTPALHRRVEAISELSRDTGIGIAPLTIRYLSQAEGVSCVLVGAASVAELEESVAALLEGPLPESLTTRIQEIGRL